MKSKYFNQSIAGFGVLAIVVLAGILGLFGSSTTFFRILVGLGLGYALTRGAFGFAGMANKTFRTGSTSLIRGLMVTIMITTVITGAFLLNGSGTIAEWVKPISWGLLVGGIMFGIGMAFSSCCATGVLQDFSVGPVRAFTTLIFFGLGVFLGFRAMTGDFYSKSLFQSSYLNADGQEVVRSGVSFLDFFKADGLNGVLGGVIITILLATGVILLARWYEKKQTGKLPQVNIELETKEYTMYERLFVKPWTLIQTATVIALLVGLLFIVTKAGWGASTVFGNWFASLLAVLGVSKEWIGEFTLNKANSSLVFFQDQGSMQNLGIIIGAIVALLLNGTFLKEFTDGLKVKPLELVLFAVGGLLMGYGSRLAMGCNVGAFFTPTVTFSLSGWFFFVFLISGGYIGNRLYRLFYKLIK